LLSSAPAPLDLLEPLEHPQPFFQRQGLEALELPRSQAEPLAHALQRMLTEVLALSRQAFDEPASGVAGRSFHALPHDPGQALANHSPALAEAVVHVLAPQLTTSLGADPLHVQE